MRWVNIYKFPPPSKLNTGQNLAVPFCSSVLSIPYAWSRLGVLCGLLTQIVVAICNATASVLLLKTASKVERTTYEDVAEAVGGPSWKLITQVLDVLIEGYY